MIARGSESSDEETISGGSSLIWFREFCASAEPQLRRALVAAYGREIGRDAAAEALAWAWEHLDRVRAMTNPVGYLWRVGQTAARREFRHKTWELPDVPERLSTDSRPIVEPALARAMAELSPRQRVAVVLVHGFGCSLSEAAERMDCRVRTVRNHLDRGMTKLRKHVGVEADDH